MAALLDRDEETAIARRDDDLNAGRLFRLGFRSAGTPTMRSAEPAFSLADARSRLRHGLDDHVIHRRLAEAILVECLQHEALAPVRGDEFVPAGSHRREATYSGGFRCST